MRVASISSSLLNSNLQGLESVVFAMVTSTLFVLLNSNHVHCVMFGSYLYCLRPAQEHHYHCSVCSEESPVLPSIYPGVTCTVSFCPESPHCLHLALESRQHCIQSAQENQQHCLHFAQENNQYCLQFTRLSETR